MMFRAVFWVVMPCKMVVESTLMMEAVRTSETSVDDHFTRQYNPEDSSEQTKGTNKNTAFTIFSPKTPIFIV
jgi:hypothetical protein